MPPAACAVAAKHVETSGQLRRPDFFRRPQRGCTVPSSHQSGLLFHDIWEPDKPRQVEGTASRCRLPCVWDASPDAAEFVSFGRHSTEDKGAAPPPSAFGCRMHREAPSQPRRRQRGVGGSHPGPTRKAEQRLHLAGAGGGAGDETLRPQQRLSSRDPVGARGGGSSAREELPWWLEGPVLTGWPTPHGPQTPQGGLRPRAPPCPQPARGTAEGRGLSTPRTRQGGRGCRGAGPVPQAQVRRPRGAAAPRRRAPPLPGARRPGKEPARPRPPRSACPLGASGGVGPRAQQSLSVASRGAGLRSLQMALDK